MSLSKKTALVTGGGRGLGRGIALALADAGASVAVAGRSVDDLAETVAAIRDSGGVAQAAACDVTDEGSVRKAVLLVGEALGPGEHRGMGGITGR